MGFKLPRYPAKQSAGAVSYSSAPRTKPANTGAARNARVAAKSTTNTGKHK
jgi:hypothetical protein